jgi:cell wall-associated NlpC family hydrolase
MKIPAISLITLLLFPISGWTQQRLSPCSNADLWGYCEPGGSVVIPQIYKKAADFQQYLGPVVREDGNWWMVNSKGILCFNSRRWENEPPPRPEKGLYKVSWFDPIFANITEYYTRYGLPVKVADEAKISGDTIEYQIFNFAQALKIAQSKLGNPYGADQLDCSGFIRFIFGQFGMTLPYFTREIAERGRDISLREAKPGDLIFFSGANEYDRTPGHVGMITSLKGNVAEFIHASTSKGVCMNKNTDPYYKKRFLFVRRIFG